MDENGYIKATGISYAGTLPKIKKVDNPLQPVFEAFTNSLEAIKLNKETLALDDNGIIIIRLFFAKNIFSTENNAYDFQSIQIEDTGIGFNDTEFNRLIALNDSSKSFSNKGTGRVQFLHAFNKTEVSSIYRDGNSSTGYKQRIFTLSKSKPFLEKNAIIRLDKLEDVDSTNTFTSLMLNEILAEKDSKYYSALTEKELKKILITRYLAYFCENRNILPMIKIKTFINGNLKSETEIISKDIPIPDHQKDIDVFYSRKNGKRIEKSGNWVTLNLKAFKINKDELEKNGLKLTSKGEIANDITLDSINPDDTILDNRYLFLLSGEYINTKDSDTRGEINIPKKSEFKKNEDTIFDEEEILLDDIEEVANYEIENLYEEIKEKAKEKQAKIEELKQMFLLNPSTIESLRRKININDSDDTILRKVYQEDAKLIAKRDAEIKNQIKQLEELDTTAPEYMDALKLQVDELVKTIPLQNRTELTHYVARRKLVLELFDKVLNKQLEIQKTGGRNMDEKLLHNLIFQQSSDNTEESDLWLINEDFIYFKGTSETKLQDIKIDNELIFNKEFEEEEKAYLLSLGENRSIKKPDILLFPDECKCIIIELKSPEVSVRTHLGQIDFYAGLIRNFTKKEYNIDTFYGYLIGEAIDSRDVRLTDQRYILSYHLDYMFRPSTPVAGDVFPNIKRSDGSIYTEVIKYSTLLKRASLRNQMFINKLMTN